jgi:hypothetical protein
VGGGTVFCSFASPNLSFWALLPLPAAAGGKARRLPSGDSGRPLDRGKYYLTFETNEGDTPRIVDSAFGSSWASPLRGAARVIPDCHFAVQLNHLIPGFLSYSVAVFPQ